MVDLFNGSVQVTVTPTTVPTVANLEALEFALVEPDPTDTGKPAQAGLGPAIGSVNVDTLPTFTWSQVADATGYEFVLAEEIGQTNSFAIINYAAGTTTNGHVARETLKYLTTYNWRVRAVGPNGNGAWQTSFFTTMDEPAPPPPPPPDPLPPVVITPTQPAPPAPEIILEVPASPAPVQVIPESVLWVVVGVGAILVIAVIVLIVRTRRVA